MRQTHPPLPDKQHHLQGSNAARAGTLADPQPKLSQRWPADMSRLVMTCTRRCVGRVHWCAFGCATRQYGCDVRTATSTDSKLLPYTQICSTSGFFLYTASIFSTAMYSPAGSNSAL